MWSQTYINIFITCSTLTLQYPHISFSVVDGTTSAEYILKVTREIEQRVEQAAAVELDRIRQGELAAVRMEQQQLYQQQLTKVR